MISSTLVTVHYIYFVRGNKDSEIKKYVFITATHTPGDTADHGLFIPSYLICECNDICIQFFKYLTLVCTKMK